MNNFLNNLNNRERNLIMAALLMVVTLILFFIVSNTIQSLNFSSKKLDKAKSDYEYVALKAQQLSHLLINQSNDPAEIESFIENSIDLDIKNLEVDNIDKALEHAQKHNAKLRICEACNVYGSHAHPEGFVAFLDDEAAGTEIEFMQVYTEEELKKYKVTGV